MDFSSYYMIIIMVFSAHVLRKFNYYTGNIIIDSYYYEILLILPTSYYIIFQHLYLSRLSPCTFRYFGYIIIMDMLLLSFFCTNIVTMSATCICPGSFPLQAWSFIIAFSFFIAYGHSFDLYGLYWSSMTTKKLYQLGDQFSRGLIHQSIATIPQWYIFSKRIN